MAKTLHWHNRRVKCAAALAGLFQKHLIYWKMRKAGSYAEMHMALLFCLAQWVRRSLWKFLETINIWKLKEVRTLEWEVKQDTLTVYPQGDLDMATARIMKEQIESILYSRLGVKHLAINLKRIRFIDSSGLGMLIGCYKYMQGRDGSMMLVEASKTVYRILELSGMKKLMPVLCGEQTK